MKKMSTVILICVILVTSAIHINAGGQPQSGFTIVINTELSGDTSIIHNDMHYVPVKTVFEKMGAVIFHRNSDRQILALSRDGDIIRHTTGESVIWVNGVQKNFSNSSVFVNNKTYVPIDMFAAVFYPDRIWYETEKLNIQKQNSYTAYHRTIQAILDLCQSCNFYPERFQRYINYHAKNPNYNVQEVLFRVNLGLDYPFYENAITIEHPYELLVLVNKYHQLPANFQQYNLVTMSRAYTANDGRQYLLAGVAYENYVKMADAAKKDGMSMRVVSAYRTEDYQRNLYSNKVRTTGKVNADKYSARPGFSEHQTGLAVDINSTKNSFEYTSEFKWLQKHAHEYGFILRYPKGKEWITGYAYEPWHYRYVGTDAARIILEEGITYEEYYAKYISANEFQFSESME